MADDDTPSRLLLIRHGQSTWNAEGRLQGQEDPPLSTLGVRQARDAARSLGGFDAVVSSPLQRALTTATIIADELGVGPVTVDVDLQERHGGAFQGLTQAEIDEQFPGYRAERRRPPGWEADEAVVERAAAALARVAIDIGPGASALVVTHGGVIHKLEDVVGIERTDKTPNLGGRWFLVGPGTFRAGDPALLVEEDEVTVPEQI